MAQMNARIKNYTQAAAYLADKNERPLGHNTRIERVSEEEIVIKYHGHPIVMFGKSGFTMLDNCGWPTYTTKERINQFVPEGFYVWQERGVWYLSRRGDNPGRWTWQNGITISDDGVVTNAGDPGEDREARKLSSRINRFAKAYAKELIDGNIPEPSGGDCWGCYMVGENGESIMGKDHLMQHLEEKYYVPSLILRAFESQRLSQISMYTLGRLWNKIEGQNDPITDWEKSILARDAQRSISKYMKHELGIAG